MYPESAAAASGNDTLAINLSSNDSRCIKFTEQEEKMLEFNSFWVEGIVLTVVAISGLFGNATSIFILNKKGLCTFFSHLLIVLSSLDSLYLLLSVVEAFRRNFNLVSHIHIYLFPYFLYPFHSFFMVASIYMTIAIAVERFKAVVNPIGIRQMLSNKSMYRKRLLKYVISAMLCAIAITIPRFFELKVVLPQNVSSPLESLNETIYPNNATWGIRVQSAVTEDKAEEYVGFEIGTTSLRTDPVYNMYYVNLTRLLFTGAGPIALLAFFYYRLFEAVRGHNEAQLQAMVSQLDETMRHKQEESLSKLFINIIVAFIVCHLPRVIINLYEMMVIESVMECFDKDMSAYGIWVHISVCYSHLLLVINASVNIIFYIWHNKIFKGHFLSLFHMEQKHAADMDASTRFQVRLKSTHFTDLRGNIQIDVLETAL